MVSIELRLNYDSWTKSGAETDGSKVSEKFQI